MKKVLKGWTIVDKTGKPADSWMLGAGAYSILSENLRFEPTFRTKKDATNNLEKSDEKVVPFRIEVGY